MNSSRLRDYLQLLLRFLIGGILVYAGFSKAIAPAAEFAAAIAAYKVLPHAAVHWAALIWPWLELMIGTYLVFGFFTQRAAQCAAGMFGLFLLVVVSALARHMDPGSCGCFGLGMSFKIQTMAILDSGLLAASLLLTYLSKIAPGISVDAWASK
jgi:uncharacterized membrane protein YphA (DoxX/SURF4 family)